MPRGPAATVSQPADRNSGSSIGLVAENNRHERWRESEREVERQAATAPDDPITHAEEVETEEMEELTEEEDEARQEEK